MKLSSYDVAKDPFVGNRNFQASDKSESTRLFEVYGGNIMIYCIVMGICAMFMFGIGLVQIKSKKPVAFYSGEKPTLEEKVKDIENWNKKHGIMWILYGIAIVIGIVGGLIVGDSPLLVVIYCGSLLLPIVIMMLYHKKLVKDYIIE